MVKKRTMRDGKGWKVGQPVVLAVVSAMALGTSGVAYAESGLERCRGGQPADDLQEIVYGGSQNSASFPNVPDPWNIFAPGDAVRVTVTGSVDYMPPFHRVAYAGNGLIAGGAFPFPGLNEVSSVARWNNLPGGWIGNAFHTADLAHCAAAPTVPARLIYMINDNVLWDNGGSWTIRTEIFRARR